jgi:Amiloride-sensitive sodium channel
MIALSQVCIPEMFEKRWQTTCYKCLRTLREISLTKQSFFKNCNYQEFTGKDCENLFEEIDTDEGICFTFNTMKMTDIFRDET